MQYNKSQTELVLANPEFTFYDIDPTFPRPSPTQSRSDDSFSRLLSEMDDGSGKVYDGADIALNTIRILNGSRVPEDLTPLEETVTVRPYIFGRSSHKKAWDGFRLALPHYASLSSASIDPNLPELETISNASQPYDVATGLKQESGEPGAIARVQTFELAKERIPQLAMYQSDLKCVFLTIENVQVQLADSTTDNF